MKLDFFISNNEPIPFVGVYATSDSEFATGTSVSNNVIFSLNLPADPSLAKDVTHNVEACVEYANRVPFTTEFAGISMMFKALPHNVSARDYIAGIGGWGLTESEQLVVNALAHALVQYPFIPAKG